MARLRASHSNCHLFTSSQVEGAIDSLPRGWLLLLVKRYHSEPQPNAFAPARSDLVRTRFVTQSVCLWSLGRGFHSVLPSFHPFRCTAVQLTCCRPYCVLGCLGGWGESLVSDRAFFWISLVRAGEGYPWCVWEVPVVLASSAGSENLSFAYSSASLQSFSTKMGFGAFWGTRSMFWEYAQRSGRTRSVFRGYPQRVLGLPLAVCRVPAASLEGTHSSSGGYPQHATSTPVFWGCS